MLSLWNLCRVFLSLILWTMMCNNFQLLCGFSLSLSLFALCLVPLFACLQSSEEPDLGHSIPFSPLRLHTSSLLPFLCSHLVQGWLQQASLQAMLLPYDQLVCSSTASMNWVQIRSLREFIQYCVATILCPWVLCACVWPTGLTISSHLFLPRPATSSTTVPGARCQFLNHPRHLKGQ